MNNPSLGNSHLRNEIKKLKVQLSEKQHRIHQLEQKAEQFRQLVDYASDWVYWLNPDGTFNYISPACLPITGYSPEEFMNNPDLLLQIIYPEDRKRIQKQIESELGNPKPCSSEFRIIHKSGVIRWIWHQCNPIFEPNGHLIGRRSSNRDITSLRTIGKKLKENERLLRMVFDGMPDPIHMIDSDFHIILTNRTLLDLKGVEQETIKGRYCYEIYQGRSEKCEPCAAEQAFATGKSSILEKTLPLPDGSIKYFEVHAFPIANDKDKITHVIELTRDITQQKNFEQELRHSRDQYLQLASAAPFGILSCDANGKITFANQAMLQMLGYSSLKSISKFNLLNFSPLDDIGITEKIKKCLQTGQSSELETPYQSRWGKNLILRIRIIPIQKENGVIDGTLGIVEDFTERSKLQKEIIKREQKFRGIFEHSPYGIVLVNKDHLITDVNPAIEKITGFSKSEIIGKYVWEVNSLLVSDSDKSKKNANYFKQKIDQIEKRLYAGDGPIRMEITIKDKNGYIHYLQEDILMIKIQDETLIVNLKKDITGQKLAEQSLQKSEKRYKEMYHLFRLIADNEPDMIWAKDLDNKYIFTNKTICEKLLNAKDVNEPIGKTDLFFAERERRNHPDNKVWHTFGELCVNSDKITLEKQKPLRFNEFGNVKGKFMFLDVHKAPLFDAQGNIIGTVGSARDVTEQKELEKQKETAQKEVKKLATVIEQADVAVIITDLDGNMEYVNHAFEIDTGYSYQEAIGQNPRILKSNKHSKEYYKELWDTITVGKIWKGEFINRKKDGTEYYEDAIIFPIYNSQGQIIKYAGILKDITKEKELEEQVQHMQKMESIGVLTGGIAHDFNNLLTVINGYTELGIAKYRDDLKIKSILQSIHTAGKRAADLTSQLLAFSRKQIISPKILDINELIFSLKKMLKRMIEEHIELEFFLPPHLPKIKADPVQIEQILMNLVVNARDAIYELPANSTHEKRIQIETKQEYLGSEYVQKHKGSKEGEYISISVSDSGIGMDSEIQAKIFDPFFTTKEVGKGTGLGLSTVYGIVKQNNGNVYVYSEKGKGSTVKIYWPATKESVKKSQATEKINLTKLQGNETILLVEDDPYVREVGLEALTEFGYTVITASSGVEALKMLKGKKRTPDLLITDLVMPSMSGKDLSIHLKEQFPNLKIMYASGYTENYIVKNGVLEEGIHFIQKPYSISEFIHLVRKVLDSEK